MAGYVICCSSVNIFIQLNSLGHMLWSPEIRGTEVSASLVCSIGYLTPSLSTRDENC